MVAKRYPQCPEKLTEEQLDQYRNDGFVVFENALTDQEVAAAKADLRELVETSVSGSDVEVIRAAVSSEKHNYSGLIYRRIEKGGALNNNMFTQLEPGFDPSGKSIDEIDSNVRKFAWFEDSSPLFHSLYTDHPRVTGVMRSILGESIQLYQSMALLKPAHGGVEKPWHQDNAYFSTENLDQVAGAWIALDDATAENGCMHFLRGGHRRGPLRHHHTNDCEIVPGKFDPSEALAAEIPAGAAIFFHGNIPHFTPKNTSDSRRRALQYHYRSASNNVISRDAYYKVFSEKDGTPASCAAATQDRI